MGAAYTDGLTSLFDILARPAMKKPIASRAWIKAATQEITYLVTSRNRLHTPIGAASCRSLRRFQHFLQRVAIGFDLLLKLLNRQSLSNAEKATHLAFESLSHLRVAIL
jgi:hypothetical protein